MKIEVLWTPFADASTNTFTGYMADDLNEEEIDKNLPTLEFGASFDIIQASTTNGWFALNFDVIDQMGPAAEPEDARDYTHKLDLELDSSFGIFNWLPKNNWLRNVKAYATLDYLAMGLPDEGDVVPKGEQLFLEDASP